MSDEKPERERAANYIAEYANNVRFHLAPMDLTIAFGQNRPDAPPLDKARITVTWAEAKIMLYFLRANIMIYETIEGKPIAIPKDQIPSPPKADESADPQTLAVNASLHKLYEEFLASL